MINGMISIVCNITLSFVLSKFIGISGVSLATSIAMLIATILLLRDIKKYLPGFSVRQCCSEIVKGVAAATVSALVLVIIKKCIINHSILFALIAEGGAVAIVYCISLFMLKSKSTNDVLIIIKNKANKSGNPK